MTDTVGQFFTDIEERRPLVPRKYTGTIRFDLSVDHRAEHWVLKIDSGAVTVARDAREADCVVRTGRDVFARIVTGDQGVYAAVWRNLLSVEGDISLIATLRELLPAAQEASRTTSRKPEV
ncbi:SCP2 sterol-binding domain-containing protein [Micromonospora sp. NPDC051296]|uniref:SCP2 sterol-binding domain-containing protein n=1 Tax=Micromonospora sp. NPDC051296 TaxID=3155046 RepID=UPI003435DBAC